MSGMRFSELTVQSDNSERVIEYRVNRECNSGLSYSERVHCSAAQFILVVSLARGSLVLGLMETSLRPSCVKESSRVGIW